MLCNCVQDEDYFNCFLLKITPNEKKGLRPFSLFILFLYAQLAMRSPANSPASNFSLTLVKHSMV